MKFLVTGINRLQFEEDYYLKQQLRVIPSEVALLRGLRELGHEVVMKQVRWGDNLDEWDRIIAYAAPTDTFIAAATDGFLWCLTRDDTLIACDDWQVGRVISDCLKPEAKWKESFVGQMNGLTDRKAADLLHSQWCCGRKILFPAYEGGDLSLLLNEGMTKIQKAELECDSMELFSYDPNPLLPLRRPVTTLGPKERVWVVAGLSDANRKSWKKLKPTLPVVEVGKRGEGGIRMPEDEIIDWYANRWFHWMPSYKHAGSGWWRARPQQLSDGMVITVCNPKEGAIFGPSWVIENPIELETMSDSDLQQLAVAQRIEFVERHPTDEIGKARSLKRLAQFVL
jgi:hypothetical protein